MQPLISVIVPIYRVEKYLEKCVNSILNQTYSNLEVILVDDGSPDACPEMCDAFAQKNSRVKVIHKENGGLASARNAGLDIANGELISFVDSDDWCEPSMLEELYQQYEATNAPVVVCDAFVDWYNGWPSEISGTCGAGDVIYQEEFLHYFFDGSLNAWAWNKLYHKSVWGNLRFPNQVYEDIPAARELLMNVEKIAMVRKPLYHYVQRTDSLIGMNVNVQQLSYLNEMDKNISVAEMLGIDYKNEAVEGAIPVWFSFLCKMSASKECKWAEEKKRLVFYLKIYRNNLLKMNRMGIFNKFFAVLVSFGIPLKMCLPVHSFVRSLYLKMGVKRFLAR